MGTNKRYPSREPTRAPTPITNWHPRQIAEAVDWELRNGWPPDPIAVVRRLSFQRGNQVEVWYRAVTWAANPAERELIGYSPDFDTACAAAWEHFHGRTLEGSPYVDHDPVQPRTPPR